MDGVRRWQALACVVIHVRDLRVDYDDVCAVGDVSLDVAAGDVFGLIGPNGAGKTTTLRALAGLIEPTYGEIVLGGFDLQVRRNEALRLLGFMPDVFPIYDDLLVWEYLDLFAASYGVPRSGRKDAIDRSLALVDLQAKRDALCATLSRGMRQRLFLAKTVLPDPKILLLDEPASGLDPNARLLLADVLGKLATDGKAIVISSHILSELSEFCTSVGVMERGRMVECGRIEDVAARVLGAAAIAIEVVAGHENVEQVGGRDPRGGQRRWDGDRVQFTFDGDREAAAALLADLVRAGVVVAAFGRIEADLRDVFRKVGAYEVS